MRTKFVGNWNKFVDLTRIFVDIAGEVVVKNLVVDTAEFFVDSSGKFVDIELEFVGNACRIVDTTRFVDRSLKVVDMRTKFEGIWKKCGDLSRICVDSAGKVVGRNLTVDQDELMEECSGEVV